MDGREPSIASLHGVAPLLFQLLQERADEGRVEVRQLEPRRMLSELAMGETKEQPEGVAVSGDRVWARAALLQQALGEPRLEERGERAHRSTSVARSSRRVANASSSGVADRYQYVAAGSACPRYVDSNGSRASPSWPDAYQRVSTRTANAWRRSWKRGQRRVGC